MAVSARGMLDSTRLDANHSVPNRVGSCRFLLLIIVPQEGVDVLVATPGRVATLLEAGVLNLEDCRAVILDEVRV